MRFRHRIQWHLFETEQQLKELRTACDEITNRYIIINPFHSVLILTPVRATQARQVEG